VVRAKYASVSFNRTHLFKALTYFADAEPGRFGRDAETLEAVRASSLEQLGRRRKAGLSTHPFYWAAFIAAGDWR
jgi:hypothetical protein